MTWHEGWSLKRVHKLGIVFSFVLLIASDMPLKSESENRKNEEEKKLIFTQLKIS